MICGFSPPHDNAPRLSCGRLTSGKNKMIPNQEPPTQEEFDDAYYALYQISCYMKMVYGVPDWKVKQMKEKRQFFSLKDF